MSKYRVMEINVDGACYFENKVIGGPNTTRLWEDKQEAIDFADGQQQLANSIGNPWSATYKVQEDRLYGRDVYRTKRA